MSSEPLQIQHVQRAWVSREVFKANEQNLPSMQDAERQLNARFECCQEPAMLVRAAIAPVRCGLSPLTPLIAEVFPAQRGRVACDHIVTAQNLHGARCALLECDLLGSV